MRLVAYLYTHPLLEYPVDWQCDPSADPISAPIAVEIAAVYQDFVGTPERPQWQALLADLQQQPVDAVVVRHYGELGDTPAAVCDRWLFLQARHIRVIPFVSLDAGLATLASTSADLSNPLEFLNFFQSLQGYQRSQSIQVGHARNRLKATPPPGKAPYGYRRGKDRYALDRAAAPVVKMFFDYFLMYGSLSGAVRQIARKMGKRISISTGHRWLTSPVYRGDLVYGNGDVITDTHLPIISRDESAQVDRLVRRNRLLPKRSASSPHALSGLVKCQTCQSPLVTLKVTARLRSQTYLYLRPIACPQRPHCPSLGYQAVLDQTIHQICAALPDMIAHAPLPNIEALQQNLYGQIQAKEDALQQLEPLMAAEILDSETAELRTYKLRAEIAQLKSQLAQIPPVNLQALAKTVSNPSFWSDLSDPERRFYLRELIDSVVIHRQGSDWHCQIRFVFEQRF